MCGRFDEYMRTWDEDRVRPNFIMDTIWQMLQSNETLILKKDFEELLDLVRQGGWGRQSSGNTVLKSFAAGWCAADEVMLRPGIQFPSIATPSWRSSASVRLCERFDSSDVHHHEYSNKQAFLSLKK